MQQQPMKGQESGSRGKAEVGGVKWRGERGDPASPSLPQSPPSLPHLLPASPSHPQSPPSLPSLPHLLPVSPSHPQSPPSPPSPLPIFLFPSELVFYSDQRSSHRRVLTLYNPYTFTIRFKMLCTAPSLYSVVEAEGSVRAKRDRFRLEVSGAGQGGKREVWAELRGGEATSQNRPTSPLRLPTPSLTPLPYFTAPQKVRRLSQFAVSVVMGVVCVAFLMLPLHSEPNSLVPSYAHVTVTQKLVCAYVLGK
ncbi:unnamed protein product, partial [Coregonus sp. 'balchen']